MFWGFIIALCAIAVHSERKFGKISYGWVIASGILAFMSLPRCAFEVGLLSKNLPYGLGALAVGLSIPLLYFGLYYVFSGVRRVDGQIPLKGLYCRELGMECTRVLQAKTNQELFEQTKEHFQTDHNVNELPERIKKKFFDI